MINHISCQIPRTDNAKRRSGMFVYETTLQTKPNYIDINSYMSPLPSTMPITYQYAYTIMPSLFWSLRWQGNYLPRISNVCSMVFFYVHRRMKIFTTVLLLISFMFLMFFFTSQIDDSRQKLNAHCHLFFSYAQSMQMVLVSLVFFL